MFFALWPSAALRAQLAALATTALDEERGRPIPADNLHLTLAFLGTVAPPVRACLETHLRAPACPHFVIMFDRLDYWSRSQMVWLTSSAETAGLTALVNDLRKDIAACGLTPETRPYRAHLTLMRKAQRPLRARTVEPIEWSVDSFVLMESHLGGGAPRYQVLRTWQLARVASC